MKSKQQVPGARGPVHPALGG